MNKIKRVIFVDSTISHEELSLSVRKDDLLLSAVRRGDLIRCLINYPDLESIVIVDGVFEQQASITHKEILWILSQEVKIVGISSLGALRAYELNGYGMCGYGTVFQRYLAGTLDGDDEVAVSYFPSVNGSCKTIAMVNLRSTLNKLSLGDSELADKMRRIHFTQRNWASIKAVVSDEIYSQLKINYVDQKKEDVLSYFQTSQSNVTASLLANNSRNIYFVKELIHQKYSGVIDFIKSSLQRMPQSPEQLINLNSAIIALDLVNYLECEDSDVNNVAFILNELNSFTYSQAKLKTFAYKIRKEMDLFSSFDFINYLDKKKISRANLSALFEGILKLEDYFFSNNHLFNT